MSLYFKMGLIIGCLICGFAAMVEASLLVLVGEKAIPTETYSVYEFHNVEIFNGNQIHLKFINNLFAGEGNDRNIYVDYVEIDDLGGTVIREEAEAHDDLNIIPSQILVDSQASGGSSYAMLIGTEKLRFPFQIPNGSRGPYTVRIRAKGDQYLGPPKLNVAVDSNHFKKNLIVPGLEQPTSMAFLPNGSLLILQQCGEILITDPNEFPNNPSTYMDLTHVTGCVGEQGLMDIRLDPDFTTNNFIYLSYRHAPSSRFRIARFTHPGGQTGDVNSEVMIWQTDISDITSHLGGGLDFGPDGKLYLTVGDGGMANDSQDLHSLSGKVIRINKDGSIPADNPFVDGPGGDARDEIWAFGLRNPFRARWDVQTNRFLIAEVGGNTQETAWEDIHLGGASKNFGWPACEGPCNNPDFNQCSCSLHDDPIFGYPHNGKDASVIGGLVYRGNQFPSQYVGAYFYGDFARGFIRYVTFDQSGHSVNGDFEFDSEAGAVVSIEEGPDGSLYYLDIGAGSLHRIIFNDNSNQAPVIVQAEVDVSTGSAPLTVNFTGMATDQESDSLVYTWTFGDGEVFIGENPTHTYSMTGAYSVFLEVSDGMNVTKSSPIAIVVGDPPRATIISPIDGSSFRAGDSIEYLGTATDSDGTLGENSFSWTVEFGHNEHTHPALPESLGMSGIFPVPTSIVGHDFHDATSYILTLTVTDSDGLSDTTSVKIFPEKVDVTFNTMPSGLNLILDQLPISSPLVLDTLIGFEHPIEAPTNQCKDGIGYDFTSWSNGVVSSLNRFTVPAHSQTLTARYMAHGSCQINTLLIENIMVGSGAVYTMMALEAGALMYTDRPYTFESPIPVSLVGQQAIRTANNDKTSSTGDPAFLQFEVNQAVDVYVLYTQEGTTLEPDWLNASQGWELQGVTVPSSLGGLERHRVVRKQAFPAGTIRLPGNGSHVAQSSMYHVVVVPR
ncbi:MAG: PQQ-dependent sugar dehydrogenase [Nitrospirales bacterium]